MMNEAAIPNPQLQPFQVLIGKWSTTGTHPYLPGKVLHGTASFEWAHGGAFMLMQTSMEEPDIPSGIALFGSDDAAGRFYMLYFDERGISRKYDVDVYENRIVWFRDHPAFSQRFSITIVDEGEEMIGDGQMSRDGGAWESDLQLKYTRAAS